MNRIIGLNLIVAFLALPLSAAQQEADIKKVAAEEISVIDECFWRAAAGGSQVGVNAYLKQGAHINVVHKGITPVMAAASVHDQRHMEVVALLLSLSADCSGLEQMVETGKYQDGNRLFTQQREELRKILASIKPIQKK